ncbi:MAG TPA: type II secretion system protein [Candidatus Saccharimonadales bacterium]|nr:type II secretion system protein [Candidatus Saccharimonadales bacterium]
MHGAGRGFTIVETLLALAISGVIFAAGITVLNGRRLDTEYQQAVYDLQSQLQSYIDQVSSKVIPGYQQYDCTANTAGTRPQLTTPYTGQTSNCLYLGQAIALGVNSDTITAYPVFGFRTFQDAGGQTMFPSTPDEASPEPAVNSAGTALLVKTYAMSDGLKVVSTSTAADSHENDLLTFYSSLQSGNISGNEILANAIRTTSPGWSQVKTCIEDSSSCTLNSLINSSWKLCVSNGARTAQINVRGTPTGVITTVASLTSCS